MKKIVFKVYSVKDYRGGAENIVKTWIRVDQLLYDGPAFAEMDSSVYDIDDFKDIHEIYLANQSKTLEYDYTVWKNYVKGLLKEIASLK